MLKVSIIIPCYQQSQYLEETIQSVVAQTYINWECILVNDGSTDNTDTIAHKWCNKDNRFKYIYKQNGGLSSARNAGLEKVTGDFIQFLDADDFLDKEKIELSIKALELDTENNIVITNFRMFDNNTTKSSVPYCKLTPEFFNFEKLLYEWGNSFTIPIHCGLFQSSFFEKFRFPEELKAKEDWIMWVCLYKFNCKTVFIDEPLALYRRNPTSMTMSTDMLPDYIRAIECFKQQLTESEFHKLSIVLLVRHYNSAGYFKYKFNELKATNTYEVGSLIKKILIKLRILKPFKYWFEKTVRKKILK